MKKILSILAMLYSTACFPQTCDSCRLYDTPIRYIWNHHRNSVNNVFDCEGTKIRVVINAGNVSTNCIQDFGPDNFKLVIRMPRKTYILDFTNTTCTKICVQPTPNRKKTRRANSLNS